MNRRTVGSRFEEEAAAFLQEQGLDILEKNYRCRMGEIDLVAEEEGTLVFVEVKYRSGVTYGWPEEAVNGPKQEKIRRAAQVYLMRCGLPEETCCRFDVVAVSGDGSIHHVRNAFGGM